MCRKMEEKTEDEKLFSFSAEIQIQTVWFQRLYS